jgi:hypothetical protein
VTVQLRVLELSAVMLFGVAVKLEMTGALIEGVVGQAVRHNRNPRIDTCRINKRKSFTLEILLKSCYQVVNGLILRF